MLVLEKSTGKVQRVAGGSVVGTALDLAVNFASERGLLSVALDPDFPNNPSVYMYWTESTTGADSGVMSPEVRVRTVRLGSSTTGAGTIRSSSCSSVGRSAWRRDNGFLG